jgi:phospholipid/cholesterol/gamma-HCH transport system permease protein
MFIFIGRSLINFFNEMGLLVNLLGKVFHLTLSGKLHWQNCKDQIVSLGYNSIGIVLITAFFIGMVFAMQITKEFMKYGAAKVVGGVLAIAIWRELAPVLTAVIVAGRVGSAITAEIGSMQVTEQVDAIRAFGVDPDYYLIAPRVVALGIMLPCLVAFFDVIGILGSYIMSVMVMGLNQVLFTTSVDQIALVSDLSGGLTKAVFFGVVIALISCRQGLATSGGALGVGIATTRSVVVSLLSIFVLNYFLSMVLF